VIGEYCKVTGGLARKSKALSGNKQNLAAELATLGCLMNTLGSKYLHAKDWLHSGCCLGAIRMTANLIDRAISLNWKTLELFCYEEQTPFFITMWGMSFFNLSSQTQGAAYHSVSVAYMPVFMVSAP